jgi:hypothetical protein
METQTYDRKGFSVEAVQVTEDNIAEVAAWCGGEIREKPARIGPGMAQYVKVPTVRPLNEKQTEAYVTDWVLKSPSGFKVYMDSFQPRKSSRNVFEQNVPQPFPSKKELAEPAMKDPSKGDYEEDLPVKTTRDKLGLSDPRERFRSAESGKFVTEEVAEANPATTVKETD